MINSDQQQRLGGLVVGSAAYEKDGILRERGSTLEHDGILKQENASELASTRSLAPHRVPFLGDVDEIMDHMWSVISPYVGGESSTEDESSVDFGEGNTIPEKIAIKRRPDEKRKGFCIVILIALIISLVVGISVGLGQGHEKRTVNLQVQDPATGAPTPAPSDKAKDNIFEELEDALPPTRSPTGSPSLAPSTASPSTSSPTDLPTQAPSAVPTLQTVEETEAPSIDQQERQGDDDDGENSCPCGEVKYLLIRIACRIWFFFECF